jgi:hypothetical protein
MSPPTSSTAQIDSNGPHLSTKPTYELRSQAEKIDAKSVAENVKPAGAEPAGELPKDTKPQVVSSVPKGAGGDGQDGQGVRGARGQAREDV